MIIYNSNTFISKCLCHFSEKSHKSPADVVKQLRDALLIIDKSTSTEKKTDKALEDVSKNLQMVKTFIYGSDGQEPHGDQVAQLAQEVYNANILPMLIKHLSKFEFECKKDVGQIFNNLLRRQIGTRSPTVEYLGARPDILIQLVKGYSHPDIALTCGLMLRESIRHDHLAKIVLYSDHFFFFFNYVQSEVFDIASDAFSTFKDLVTKHKSMCAEFLDKNYDKFFTNYQQLLNSKNYVTRRQSLKLLGELLLDRHNFNIMTKYISNPENLKLMMELLRDRSRNIQYEAFHVFKVFVANPNKPRPISDILNRNREKLVDFLEILAGYLKLARPVRNPKDALKVHMKVFLQQILNLDGKNQIIEVNAWLKYVWMDYRLRWDPKKYDNITSIRFAGGENQIWRPDVLLYNSANEDFDSSFKSNEVVYNTGEVNWIPPGIFRASCKMDITYFPFDDQVCYLKFGSWTYHGLALDLSIIAEEDDEEYSIDLSTYTPSGEWLLLKAPAIKDIKYNSCCPEPYSTVTFYMFLRRRTLFYLFNVILPSLLISIMTLMGFCLPAHDMSEKIGYQTTILLSICFFVTIVSEMTPPTSESVPLLGMFFSSLTLISAVSTAFTITVLNFRYRQVQNIHMHPVFYKVFLIYIPWLLLMKRPGVYYKKRKATTCERDDESFFENCEDECCPTDHDYYEFNNSLSIDSAETLPLPPRPRPLLKKLASVPAEHLRLDRKVGDGILKSQKRPLVFSKNLSKSDSLRKRRYLQFEKYVKRCIDDAKMRKGSTYSTYAMTIISYYRNIDGMLKSLNGRLDKQKEYLFKQEDWKFAAMALDRFCLLLVTVLVVVCIFGMCFSTPHFDI
ncbi:unnamed protein product [Caenorhabditis angaria]|uniref:Neurotransmitter-gated ion-channel transmembrane domain-containing protein n=1 Tax=Caenorhabditis angaria TaxID=860376 RepID=A0A9P1NA65_9PELO|nr:unnamed protein product [Caenorhabditis angaria]